MRHPTWIAMALLLSWAAAASAQQPPSSRPPAGQPMQDMHGMPRQPGAASGGMAMGGMQMGAMQMGAMMDMMRPEGAAEILDMASALGLTPDQVQRLNGIRERARATSQPHLDAAMRAHHAAMQALAADPADVARYEAQLRETATHYVEAQVALARSGAEAMAVLTPEQRANVRFAERLRHTRMMEGMMGGGRAMGGMEGMQMQHGTPAAAQRPGQAAPPVMQHDSTHHH